MADVAFFGLAATAAVVGAAAFAFFGKEDVGVCGGGRRSDGMWLVAVHVELGFWIFLLERERK